MARYSNGTKEIFYDRNKPEEKVSTVQKTDDHEYVPLGLIGTIASLAGIFVAALPLGIAAIVLGVIGYSKICNALINTKELTRLP